MADKYWVGGKSGAETDPAQADNWASSSGGSGGAGVPTLSDAVIFDNGSNNYHCTATALFSCASLIASSACTRNLTFVSISAVGTVSFDHTGNLSLASGTITITGDGDFHIGSGVGAFTGGANLDMRGTGNLDIDKDISASMLSDIKVAYSGKTITNTGSSSKSSSKSLTVASGGTFTISATFYIGVNTTSTPITFLGTYTINGSASLYIRALASSITITVPAITLSGTGGLYMHDNAAVSGVTYNFDGAINTGTNTLGLYSLNSSSVTFNTNNNSITCGTLNIGSVSAGGSFTFNAGSSSITCTSYGGSTYNTGTININLQTSQWTVKGNFVFGTNSTVNAGTSLITFSTNNANIFSNGKSFYDITINGTGKTYAIGSDLLCHTLTITAGVFTDANYNATLTGDFSCNSDGNFTAGGTWTFTGNSNFSFNTSGTATSTNWKVDLQGTGNYTDSKGVTLSKLTCAASGKTTTITGGNNGAGTKDVALGGGTLTINQYFYIFPTSNYTFTQGSTTINGTSRLYLVISTSGATFTIASVSYSGSGSLYILGANNSTINLSGNIATTNSTARLYMTKYAAGACTINTQNYNIASAGTFYSGNSNATGDLTFNCGSSSISCASFNTTSSNTGNTSFNMSTSQWAVTGDFAFGNKTTVSAGTSTITFTTNAATLTSAGNTLYNVTVNNLGSNTLTLADALSCHTLTLSGTGNFADGGFSKTMSGDYTIANSGTLTNTGTVSVTGTLTINAPGKTISTGANVSAGRLRILAGSLKVKNGSTITMASYTLGDWDNANLSSTVDGSTWILSNPVGMKIKNITIRDCTAGNVVKYKGKNLGGCYNWFLIRNNIQYGFSKRYGF